MQEKGCHVLAAESEAELDEWVTALKRALEYEDRQVLGDRVKDKGSSDILSHLQTSDYICMCCQHSGYVMPLALEPSHVYVKI